MSSSAEEKTENATPKRRQDARKKGQIPRSRELTTAAVVLGVTVVVLLHGGTIARGAGALLRAYLQQLPAALATPGLSLKLAATLIGQTLQLIAPVLLVGFVTALVAPLLVGGWNLAPSAIALDFSRVNPFAGLKRLFSMNSVVELGKGFLKVSVIGVVGTLLFLHERERLLSLPFMPLQMALGQGAGLALDAMLWLGGGLLLIAAVDVPWQLLHHSKQLKMSKQEIKQEYEQSEGKPEVKGRIRRLQQEFARGRMMEAVPKADVIVTNPTHYAVALQYAVGKDKAPRVVAKGADLIAQQIRELAQAHRVPLVEAPPLARALYRSCEIDAEIPGALYQAVAQVLSYVYQLRDYRRGERPVPPRVAEDLPNSAVDPS
ncbi:MAG: flagellar biosynthesis protein FlhB [Stagnimonas sp.]|nr:flagellar biosynthesis protein FlhB [Stagnimonas sp.]